MSRKSNRGQEREAAQRNPSATLPEVLLPDRVARGSSGQAREDPTTGTQSAARIEGLLPERGTLESSSGQARGVGRNAFLAPPAALPPVGGAPGSSEQSGRAREYTPANPTGKHTSASGARGGSEQAPAGLAAREDVIAEGSTPSSRTLVGEHAELINRMVSNTTATTADSNLFCQSLLQGPSLYRELLYSEKRYRELGQVPKADRVRGLIASVLLHYRSRPFHSSPKERNPDNSRETPQKDEAREVQAGAADQALAETIERILHGTASKAQKTAFTHDLMISEDLFEGITVLKNQLEQAGTKADQDKANRLARLLNYCNQGLLRMHEDAAAAADIHISPAMPGRTVPGNSLAGASASRGSAAGGSEESKENPAGEEAPVPRGTNTLRRVAQTPVPLQSEAASQSSQNPFVQELRGRASLRAAADAQQHTAVIADMLEQTRLGERQQRVQETKRPSSSRGRPKASPSTNPKKAKKGRHKK